jgi:hypothetical protein
MTARWLPGSCARSFRADHAATFALVDGATPVGSVDFAVTVTPDGNANTSADGDDQTDDDATGGCAAGGGSAGWLALAPVLLVLRRRRR